ncbi:hypothetical protein ASPWEDRAFT_187153 [Aspergillus wentii DTO 134E9]|uniref:HNH nuclease domain-containing protein n=1 Tax=Aspergillus wentii DTO 134E9 TaxID=1073089 RepID=A0A1L9R8I2_ASPWE|nr:uncharacterized protein ASPWEDRAFT_187153 [Aspergillus wentii DTO 134E9]OJJ31235.1 hypothetical protein ASPWEDRAFT_187153 [Aspergillus wentii DTO 134E9]
MSAAPELEHPDRAGLISEISRIYEIDSISTSLWLFLWFADIERLRHLVKGASLLPVFQELSKRALEFHEDFDSVLRLWLARPVRVSEEESNDRRKTEPGSIPESSSSEAATSKPQGYSRDRKLSEACIARDEGRCQITRAGDLLEVCHIYPQDLNKRQKNDIQMRRFWATLRIFWTQDKVEAWKDELEPNGTEILQNLITMTRQAHGYWGNARFALFPHKPSDDGKSMDVNGKLFNCATGQKITSGTVITLRTSDPMTHPLPSYALLQMQWYLNRIAGLSGAAEFDNDRDEDGTFDDEIDGFSD